MKKLIAILTLAAILLTSVVAFADEVLDGTITEIQGDIMLINEPVLDGTIDEVQGDIMLIDETEESNAVITAPIEYGKQVLEGTLVSVEEGQLLINVGSEYVININENTLIINENAEEIALADLKAESKVRVVASNMTTRSIPPQSYGYVVMVSESEEPAFPFYASVVTVESDEESLVFVTADGEYIISVTDETKVTDIEGNELTAGDIERGTNLLFNTQILTFSLPARGTADSVIILGEDVEPEFGEEVIIEPVVLNFSKVIVNGTEVATKVVEQDDVTLLHVRAVCEAMGLEVAWDENLFAVTVGTVPMGVNFKIGENAYNKARMMPFTLSAAPQLINDELTYVPVDFYTEVLGAEVTIVDGVLNVNYTVE